MRGIVIGLVAMSLIFVLVDKAMAEQQIIEVRPGDKELYETEPRQIITTSFRISNNSKERREFEAQVKIPSGWKLITREFPFELGPEESDVRLVSFFVPQNTLAGKYEVIYLVQDRIMPSISDFWTISVIVLSVAKLEAKVLEAPVWIIAGQDYQVSFLVINRSNTATLIMAEIVSADNWPAVVDTKEFQLVPGESKVVKVVVKTDSKLQQKMKHRLKMTVKAPELKNGEVEASATAWVEIIPRTSATAERFHKIPVEIKMGGVIERNKDTRQGLQSEISGFGTLDEQGRKHIDFLFRWPDLRQKSPFGKYDEFRLSHWTEKYEVHLGDRVYFLSPLTEYYRYGRGIEGKVKLNNFTIGGYRKKVRWLKPERKETAGYINYLIDKRYSFGLNYLQKHPSNDKVFSFRGELEPSEAVSLELEVASGKKGAQRDSAYFLSAIGSQRWFSGQLRLIHAGPHYPGYYRDIDLKSGSLALSLWKFRLSGDFYVQTQNLELNPKLYYASAEKFYQTDLTYRFKSNTRVSFSHRNRSRKDRLPEPKYNYQENTFRIELGQSFPRLNFWLAGEQGSRDDKLNQRSYGLKKYWVSIFATPIKRQSISGYLQVQDQEFYKSVTAGLNTLLRIRERSLFRIGLQNRWRDKIRISKLIDISLEHQFSNDYLLLLQARRLSYSNIKPGPRIRNSFLFELSIPFGLPVSRKKGIGQLNGVLYDVESQEKLVDVLIRINEVAAVTDKNGKFRFPALKPGKHFLEVDKAGIGLDKITTKKMPLEVIIEGGKETQVEIGVTRSATLRGKVMVFRAQNNPNNFFNQKGGNNNVFIFGEGGQGNVLNRANSVGGGEIDFVEFHGLANIIVEIANGLETKRRVTDREGRFWFEELRPGEWELKVYDTNLPKYHYFEEDIFEILLGPGEEKEVLIKVFPKKRPIRIIGEGGVLEEK